MSHTKIIKKIKDYTEERSQKLNQYYENEGLLKGTMHTIVDDFKRPWKHIKGSDHTAVKIALVPYALIDAPIRFFSLPVSAPVSAAGLYINHKVVQFNEREKEEHASKRRVKKQRQQICPTEISRLEEFQRNHWIFNARLVVDKGAK